ncbi:VOC family protein [Desulfovibrio inopinatus]|uniref:VOC family protein n=1 Tax=Desulfovibrio inopinatus TaxID=102109 RepID=UPI000427E624|nr:VOC family protein [Desulfovibrio inopinatus]
MDSKHIVGKIVGAAYVTNDLDEAKNFYANVFGWSYRPASTPFDNQAFLALKDDAVVASMGDYPADRHPDSKPGWRIIIAVEDVEAAIQAAVESGGKIILSPSDKRANGVGMVQDADGAMLGLVPLEAVSKFKFNQQRMEDDNQVVERLRRLSHVIG